MFSIDITYTCYYIQEMYSDIIWAACNLEWQFDSFFGLTLKKLPKLRINGALWWESLVTSGIPSQGPVTHKAFACYHIIIKTPLLHMLYYMNWLTHDFWTRTGGWEFDRSHGSGTSSPSHWQQVEEQAPKPVGWMMCFLLMTLVPVQKLCVNIYIYMHSLYEFCYRTYIYIQQECHSVLAKLHPITFYRIVFLGSARFLGWMPLSVFFGLPIVSCSLIKV